MNNLLDLVILAHGGLEKWESLTAVSFHVHTKGEVYEIKNREGVIRHGIYEAQLHEQRSSFTVLDDTGQKSFYTPNSIEFNGTGSDETDQFSDRGNFVDKRTLEVKWNDLQTHYFINSAWWTNFTSPFNFAKPGYVVKELRPWQEGNELWQRLEVTFPDHVNTHNKVQLFYFDQQYLLRRHDYAPSLLNSIPLAQYVFDYKEFSGILVPTRRRVYLRNEDRTYIPYPIMASVNILNAKFK